MLYNSINDKQIIFWDFDGVIINSTKVRTMGYRKVLSKFSNDFVNELIDYHLNNEGLSRYHKFKVFFERIIKEKYTNEDIQQLADSYSTIMKGLLGDKNLLIKENINYIKTWHSTQKFHIVSGSDQTELRLLCNKLNIDQYFLTIQGSPTPKDKLVTRILKKFDYDHHLNQCVLIGDNPNDFKAAKRNNISFVKYPY